MFLSSRILVAWRGHLAAMLALLLTISIVGQQLPCMHATTASAAAPSELVTPHQNRSASHHQHATEHIPTPAPGSHHDPAAPGCAQLMACGLVVQSQATTVTVADAVGVLREAPVGVPLAFTTAELEVESPPPRG